MSAQVLVGNKDASPTAYSMDTGNDGRPLEEMINGLSMLSGMEFPDLNRIEVNSLRPTGWAATIRDGDTVSIAPVVTATAEEPPKEEAAKEVTVEALKEEDATVDKVEKTEVEKVVVKMVKQKVDLSSVIKELGKMEPHLDCLDNDLSVLEDRLKALTDHLSGIRKTVSAAKEHSTQFRAVIEESNKNVQNIETQLNVP